MMLAEHLSDGVEMILFGAGIPIPLQRASRRQLKRGPIPDGALTTAEMAGTLGTSKRVVHQMRRNRQIMGLRSVPGVYLYPHEQLSGSALIPGIAEVFMVCGDPLAAWHFLISALPEVGHANGFEALKSGALGGVLSVKLARDMGAFS